MNNIIKIILAISLISSVGCWSAENANTTNSVNPANTATVTSAENTVNATDLPTGTTAENSANSPSENDAAVTGSPMATLKELNVASKAKDPAAIKNTLSNGTLAMIEESAKNQKKSVDELLKDDDGAPFKELPEMRNEKISGNTATVEVKNVQTNEWITIPFVVENGKWKAALDVLYQNLQQQFLQDQQKKAGK